MNNLVKNKVFVSQTGFARLLSLPVRSISKVVLGFLAVGFRSHACTTSPNDTPVTNGCSLPFSNLFTPARVLSPRWRRMPGSRTWISPARAHEQVIPLKRRQMSG
eukprot:5091021-Amphidinium_carterae.1